MATDITVGGRTFFNASAFSVSEEATSLNPADTGGAIGQFTFAVQTFPGAKEMRNRIATLRDGSRGSTVGTVRSFGVAPDVTTLTADSRMSALNVERQTAPYSGTLGGALAYYFGLCGITEGVSIDESLAAEPFVAAGWEAKVWDKLKEIASALQIELSLVSDKVVARRPRNIEAQTYRNESVTFSVDATNAAQSVEVHWYDKKWRVNDLAYPKGGWNDDVQVYQVDAGEVLEVDIALEGVSLQSVQQPVAYDRVTKEHTAYSAYAVSGNDGLPVKARQWTDRGGDMKVAISEDTRSLKVTITGAYDEQYAPYRIAMPSGPSDYYSSLRLVGTGVFFDENMLTYYTGADPDLASTKIGATIENENIETEEDAFRAAATAAAAGLSSTQQSITVNSVGINRSGEMNSYIFPILRDFNKYRAGQTIAQFNADHAGQTIAQFSNEWTERSQADFANQAFGNVAGARVLDDGCWYRIRPATITPNSVQYTAERDTTVGDFDAAWTGLTIADFNARLAGKQIGDYNVRPVTVA